MRVPGAVVSAVVAVVLIGSAAVPEPAHADAGRPWMNTRLGAAQRAALLRAEMTLEEKVALMTSDQTSTSSYFNAPIERLGIPALTMTDAGSGVAPRGWSLPKTGGKATALPAQIALGATFSPAVARRYAAVVADEVRATGQNLLLGPGTDVARQPWFGRIAESAGESPILTATLNTAMVKELQARHVIASPKHYLGYNQEVDRNVGQNSIIDQQTLREVYALAFESAVRQADLGAVMCSYNKINGEYSCQNRRTARALLKGRLRFSGFMLSDLGALRDTLSGLAAGTDLEAGTSNVYDGALLAAVQSGEAPLARVDEAVLRILSTMFRIGLVEHDQSRPGSIPVARHNQVARAVEGQAITLLKNKDDVLPLTGSAATSIALIGADADTLAAASGSGWVDPTTSTTTLQGLRNRAGRSAVTWTAGNDRVNGASMIETADQTTVPSSVLSTEDGSTGLTAQYWDAPGFSGDPSTTRTERQVSYDVGFPTTFPNWLGAGSRVPVPPVGSFLQQQSVRYSGYLTAPRTGRYTLSLTGWGDATMTLDGKRLLSMTGKNGRRVLATKSLKLDGGSRHRLRIDYQAVHPVSPLQAGGLLLQWKPPAGTLSPAIAKAVAAARKAKVAVVYVRTFESEERDRVSLKLPQSADQLIRAVAAANPRTVVVLASAGPVTMPWIHSVAGVVQTYFGGQAQGAALADVLFGDVNPSGRLPLTYPGAESDVPVANPWDRIGRLDVRYREGVDVGYRGYEKAGIKPLFPFGYGLSYTSFSYSRVPRTWLVTMDRRGSFHVRFTVTNTGDRRGTATPQVYVTLPQSAGERTARFVASRKVTVPAHSSRTVDIVLKPRSATRPLSYYDVSRSRWVVAGGTYRVAVSSAAGQPELTTTMRLRERS